MFGFHTAFKCHFVWMHIGKTPPLNMLAEREAAQRELQAMQERLAELELKATETAALALASNCKEKDAIRTACLS